MSAIPKRNTTLNSILSLSLTLSSSEVNVTASLRRIENLVIPLRLSFLTILKKTNLRCLGSGLHKMVKHTQTVRR